MRDTVHRGSASADGETGPGATPSTAGRILETARALMREAGADHVAVTAIARRLGMSHSNVYRFFPNKAALLDAVMTAWLSEIEATLAATVEAMPAPVDRLAAYVLTLQDEMRRRARADPADFAAYATLSERAAGAMTAHATRCRAILEAILRDGIAREAFATANVTAAARAIDNATLSLRHPKFVQQALATPTAGAAKGPGERTGDAPSDAAEKAEEEAEDLVVLILDGIRR